MFSATKNFFLTFIIALVIFGIIAYMIVGLVLDNLMGLGASIEQPGGDDTTTDSDVGNDGPGGVGTIYGDGGESFNMILIGTDYRPSEFVDYDPEMLKLLYGIEKEKVQPSSVPTDITPKPGGVMSDKQFWNKDGLPSDDGGLVFDGGFYSVKYRVIEADAILLIRVDKERGEYTYSVFPSDAYVEVSNRYYKLSEVYGLFGLETFIEKINAITGIPIDNYAVVNMEAFPAIIDTLGGIMYNVPCNMKYTDVSGGIDIDLKAGNQVLNGDAALDLLMFDNYPPSTGSRANTLLTFAKRFVATFISITNFNKAPKVFAQVIDAVETDFTVTDFSNNIDMIFKLATNGHDIAIKTKNASVNNKTLFVIDETATVNAFAEYRRIYN